MDCKEYWEEEKENNLKLRIGRSYPSRYLEFTWGKEKRRKFQGEVKGTRELCNHSGWTGSCGVFVKKTVWVLGSDEWIPSMERKVEW